MEEQAAQDLYDKAVAALEKVLGVKRRHVNFHEEWKKTNPGSDEVYEDYIQEVGVAIDQLKYWTTHSA